MPPRILIIILSTTFLTLGLIHWWYNSPACPEPEYFTLGMTEVSDASTAHACVADFALEGIEGKVAWKIAANNAHYTRDQDIHVVHLQGNVQTDIVISGNTHTSQDASTSGR